MKLFRFLPLFLLSFLIGHPSDLRAQSTVIEINNSSGSYSKSSFFKAFEIEYEGEIEIGPNDRTITAMAPGAFLKISKSAFGSSRKIVVEANENGIISRKYYIGWRQKEFSPEGSDWLREILPEIVRTTSVGARSRVERFYTQAGVQGVLNEIPLLGSDYLQTKYLELLLEKKPSAPELVDVLEIAKNYIGSDHYLSDFLEENLELFTANDQLLNSFIEAGQSIGSDFYQSELLTKAADNKSLSNRKLVKMLIGMGPQVSSDHYLSQVLAKAFAYRSFNSTEQRTILRLTGYISSDHYHSELLIKVLKEKQLLPAATSQLIKSLERISSDHYYTQVVRELKNKPIGDKNLRRLLNQMGLQVASDHYLAQSLSYLIQHQKFSDPVFQEFIQTTRSINSDHYTQQVVAKVAAEQQPSEQNLVLFLQSLSLNVSSDHYLAASLSDLAPLVKAAGPKAREAYLEATKTIQSDTYLGQATRSLQ